MSLPSLLRHHGIEVPRYVTVNGTVIIADVVPGPSGPVHAAHGPVTQLEPHRFHGGDPMTVTSEGPWWAAPDAIARQLAAVAEAFPGFRYVPGPRDIPTWEGTIDTGRGRFAVSITMPSLERLPRVRVNGVRLGRSCAGRWVKPEHLYTNDQPCIASSEDWNPDRHTAATAIAWLAHWLAAYTEWWMTMIWPGEGATHVV